MVEWTALLAIQVNLFLGLFVVYLKYFKPMLEENNERALKHVQDKILGSFMKLKLKNLDKVNEFTGKLEEANHLINTKKRVENLFKYSALMIATTTYAGIYSLDMEILNLSVLIGIGIPILIIYNFIDFSGMVSKIKKPSN